jgi:orotidine-5'-phosphate decarboxylase
MMQAVATGVRAEASRSGIPAPKVLAITVLTSLSTAELRDELNVSVGAEEQVLYLARLAMRANMDGVVASPRESRLIRQECGADFTIVTPGIRPAWAAEQGDQKRITTPSEAIRLGSDIIVVGRPILAAKDRVGACKHVLSEISEALST